MLGVTLITLFLTPRACFLLHSSLVRHSSKTSNAVEHPRFTFTCFQVSPITLEATATLTNSAGAKSMVCSATCFGGGSFCARLFPPSFPRLAAEISGDLWDTANFLGTGGGAAGIRRKRETRSRRPRRSPGRLAAPASPAARWPGGGGGGGEGAHHRKRKAPPNRFLDMFSLRRRKALSIDATMKQLTTNTTA